MGDRLAVVIVDVGASAIAVGADSFVGVPPWVVILTLVDMVCHNVNNHFDAILLSLGAELAKIIGRPHGAALLESEIIRTIDVVPNIACRQRLSLDRRNLNGPEAGFGNLLKIVLHVFHGPAETMQYVAVLDFFRKTIGGSLGKGR